jgi:GntR family transcriptional regulator
MISRDTPVPPYLQVAGILRDQIEAGKLRPGSRLPTLLQLAEDFEVAVSTARKAIAVLKSEGLVFGVAGYGTFVRQD